MFSTPAVVGDVVSVGSCVGAFYALDRSTGQLRGRHDVFSADSVRRQFHGDALIDHGLLLIGTDTGAGDTAYVLAFERGTAKVRWRLPAGPGVMSDLARWNDRAYAVTLMDELICFDLASGALLWSYRPDSSVYNDRTGAPVVVGKKVLFADREGTIRAFDAETGRPLWRAPQIEPPTTWMATVDSSVLFMRGTEALVRLDPNTGNERRRSFIGGGPYRGALSVIGDSLLLMLGTETLTAFDLRLDRVRWSRTATQEWTSSRPYVWRDMVLAGDQGRLIVYGLADGTERWTQRLDGMIRGIGSYGDTLYVGTLKGPVHALVVQTK